MLLDLENVHSANTVTEALVTTNVLKSVRGEGGPCIVG